MDLQPLPRREPVAHRSESVFSRLAGAGVSEYYFFFVPLYVYMSFDLSREKLDHYNLAITLSKPLACTP